MSTYQDVVNSARALSAWAFTESSGLDFAPYISAQHLTGSGTFTYRNAGPFATSFGLQFNVGAKAGFTFAAVVTPPFTTEAWFKLPSATPAANTFLEYNGAQATNGSGVYVATNGHIHVLFGGRVDTDTLVLWPDANWHLVQFISGGSSTYWALALDGIVRWRATPIVPNAPSPNVLNYCGDSAGGAAVVTQVAMAAIYAYDLTAGQVASNYLASTDPAGALGGTVSGGGGTIGGANDMLNKIYEAVTRIVY